MRACFIFHILCVYKFRSLFQTISNSNSFKSEKKYSHDADDNGDEHEIRQELAVDEIVDHNYQLICIMQVFVA